MKKMKEQKKRRAGKLDPVRQRLQPLVDKANRLIRRMLGGQKTTAYYQAMESLRATDRDKIENGEREDFELFSVEDKHSTREIAREASRLATFLQSQSGSARGIELEQRQLKANEWLGTAFRDSNFHDSDKIDERLDEDIARVAWEVYRRIEETGGAALLYDEGGYGSENAINFIYATISDFDDPESDEAKAAAIRDMRYVLEKKRREQRVAGQGFYRTGGKDYGFLSKVAKAKHFDEIMW